MDDFILREYEKGDLKAKTTTLSVESVVVYCSGESKKTNGI